MAARCRPVEAVGGDFYTFRCLGEGRVGVLLGDVSSHGPAAAAVMVRVLHAADQQLDADACPEAALRGLLTGVTAALQQSEMFFTAFYGVLDRSRGVLRYANAGHAHAWRVARSGEAERLQATVPPLGLVPGSAITGREVPWAPGSDLLCLWTDGMVEAANALGERFGEGRLLEVLTRLRDRPVDEVVAAAFAAQEAWAGPPVDDRTLLVLRT